MDTGGVTVFAVCLIIIVLIFVSITNFFIPFYKKIELVNTVTEYYSLMEVNGGMTSQEATALNDELLAKKFYNVTITPTLKGTAIFGQPLTLDVKSQYNIYTFGIVSNLHENWVTPVSMNFKLGKLYKRIEE